MFEDREGPSTAPAPAWAWLRGFAYFLLAWPLLSLLALDQFELDEWQSILIAVLGPAGIGLLLLCVGLAALALLTPAASTTTIVLLMALCGAGFALFQSPNLNALMSSAPPERSAGASGMVAMARPSGQALGAALVLAYSYRFEAERAWNRVAAELVPDRIRAMQGAIRVQRAADGHFYMRALVNNVEVRFLVDTGATTTVLDPRDAVRVGLDPRKLSFNESFRTANGIVRGARVSLAQVAFGPVEFRDVRASVNGAPLGTSLLGISTLARFRAWRVEDGTLTLEY